MASSEQRQSEKLYRREYRKRNPEQGRSACKRWREKNREAELARNRSKGKKYRDANKPKQAAYLKKWRAENKTRILDYSHRRKALKFESQVDPAGIASWMRQMRALPFCRCHWCGTKIKGRAIRFDHVIPISKGGSHTIGNICAACEPCNASKSARLISDWIVGGQTFLPI